MRRVKNFTIIVQNASWFMILCRRHRHEPKLFAVSRRRARQRRVPRVPPGRARWHHRHGRGVRLDAGLQAVRPPPSTHAQISAMKIYTKKHEMLSSIHENACRGTGCAPAHRRCGACDAFCKKSFTCAGRWLRLFLARIATSAFLTNRRKLHDRISSRGRDSERVAA